VPRNRVRLTASRSAFVLRAPDGQATHLQARPARPVRSDRYLARQAGCSEVYEPPSSVCSGKPWKTLRVGRVGPRGEYPGVHVGAKLRTKRRGEYYFGVSADRRIATPLSEY
jgi:hypothetical protein